MVTEWFLNWVTDVLRWLVELLPDWDVPAELADPTGPLQTVLSNIGGTAVWVDWGAIILLAAIPPAVWLIGIAWKALRTAFSHFPGIGGSG